MTLSLDPALQQEIESVIAALDAARKSGQPAHTQAAMQECDRVIAALGEPVPATADGTVERALDPKAGARSTLWLKRGHLLEATGTGEAAGQALESYGRAIAALEGEPGTGPKMGRAIAWMNRGNVLQRFRDERAWSDAVRCYDQAVGWLGSLSEKGQVNAELASALGAAWMNRGAALRQFGKPERWTEALKSFEQALGLFQQLATSSAAAMPNVITAWEARGEAKLALGEPAEAVRSHEEALGTLRSWNERTGQALEPWDFGRIIFKLGQARAQAGDADGALRELREVLKLVAADERDEVPAAVLGLQGRHAVGVILGARLAADGASAGAADLRAEAGDLAEDGLAIAAIWGTVIFARSAVSMAATWELVRATTCAVVNAGTCAVEKAAMLAVVKAGICAVVSAPIWVTEKAAMSSVVSPAIWVVVRAAMSAVPRPVMKLLMVLSLTNSKARRRDCNPADTVLDGLSHRHCSGGYGQNLSPACGPDCDLRHTARSRGPEDYPASRASSSESMICRRRNRNEAPVPVQITPHTV